MARQVPWIFREQWLDSEGRSLFVKGSIGTQPCTLPTIYVPNSAKVTPLERTLGHLQTFAEGILILGSDLNLTLDLRVDSTKNTIHFSYTALRRIKKCLFTHQFVDVWWNMSPSGRDYTYYSHPHN